MAEMMSSIPNQLSVEWSVAARPLAGEAVPGDMHLVKGFEDGALLAVVDGLGHGEEAVVAAQAAISVLQAQAEESVVFLVKSCHAALAKTRGVVMTLASVRFSDRTLTWLGVGNVEGRLLRADSAASHPSESVLLRSGLVGYQLPVLQADVLPIAVGDLLIFATDGVQAAFDEGISLADSTRTIADRILSRCFKGTDDALVLVARYLGRPHE
jgi:serine phosphatase RsbU (regulator of sigma subunit)